MQLVGRCQIDQSGRHWCKEIEYFPSFPKVYVWILIVRYYENFQFCCRFNKLWEFYFAVREMRSRGCEEEASKGKWSLSFDSLSWIKLFSNEKKKKKEEEEEEEGEDGQKVEGEKESPP